MRELYPYCPVESIPAHLSPRSQLKEPLKHAHNGTSGRAATHGLPASHFPISWGKPHPGAETEETDAVKVGMDSQYRLDSESVADAIEQLVVGREATWATEIHPCPRTPRSPTPYLEAM